MKQRNGCRLGWPSPVSLLLFELAFFGAYYFGVASARDGIAPFWFADAVLLCALLLSHPKEWWLYILATVPVRFFLFVSPGLPLWFLFAGFAIDSLKGLLSAWLLRCVSRHRVWFDNLHEFIWYFLVAVVLAPGLSAFADGASHAALGHAFWTSFEICFFGGALPGLVLAPFILLVLNYKSFPVENLRYVEALPVAAGLALTTYVAFQGGPIGGGFPPFLLYLPVPFLLWSAVRFGPIGASASLLLMNVLSIFGTLLARGPFYLQSREASLLSMQLSLFLASAPCMFLSVIMNQQRTKLVESKERFGSLVDVAPVMLWMSGTDARCTFFNKPWLDFAGLSLKEQADQDWVVRVHPEDRERCVNKYLSAFKSREDFALEYRVLRNDGVYRWVLHNGVPRYADDGSFLGYVGSRVDFTDRREVEVHLRELSTQLLNAQEIERHRIGNELHEDLAQKLCALSMKLNRFSRGYDGNGHLAADLKELQEQLRNVSNDVVRLSHQLRPATVGGLMLSAALRNLCQQATDHKHVVLFVQIENIPPLSENVSLPLYRIAQDSLRNALTHSGATHINVELSASATMVRLSVRDNGCGFVVGSDMRLGLGLSGMSERMKSSGGAFTIISNPGEGTTVVATMPLTQRMTVGIAV
jgi:PAS domain S-box-containing protein